MKRIISLFLCVSVLMSLCACKKATSKTTSSNKETSSTSSEVDSNSSEIKNDVADSSDIVDIIDDDAIDTIDANNDFSEDDSNNNNNDYDDDDGTIDVVDPVIDDDDDDGDGDIDDDWDFDDDLDDEMLHQNPIQKYGTPVTGTNRSINIDCTKVAFSDFIGFGDNKVCCTLSDFARNNYEYNDVVFEFDSSRVNKMHPNVTRLVFDLDWMITDTEADPNRADYKNNKDYINYINGVYDFTNDNMVSNFRYLQKMKETGTEVEVSFGWKISSRIVSWFAMPIPKSAGSAPYELKPFVNAAQAFLEHCLNDKKLTNVKYLSYYNEPNNGGDFGTVGDSVLWWAKLAKYTREMLNKSGLNKKIELWGAEQACLCSTHLSYTKDLNSAASQYFDYYSAHRYYHADYYGAKSNYDSLFDEMVYYRNLFGTHRIVITEMWDNAGSYGRDNDYTDVFGNSFTSYIIGAANSGVRGVLAWGTMAGYWTEPINGMQCGGWIGPSISGKCGEIEQKRLAEAMLLYNYVPTHSDVMNVTFTGEDIKASVFKTDAGDYTILVEANDAKTERNIDFNFSKTLNKKIYRYHYIRNTETNDSITIIGSDKTIDVTSKFTDNIDKNYGMYIYSTIKPRKQIELDKVWLECQPGGNVTFSATPIDCNINDSVKWKIVAATNENGTISGGVYTAPASANAGDMVAIKAYLDSDESVYTVVVVKII